MSRIDPQCFPSARSAGERVCANCFADEDLELFIRAQAGPRGCDFCGRRDAPTIPFYEVAEYIGDRMAAAYGKAVDRLPYETAEGSYQGWCVDTNELLFDTIGLELPRDDGELSRALVDEIGMIPGASLTGWFWNRTTASAPRGTSSATS